MKARQKGKINKRLEFEQMIKEEFYSLLKDAEQRGKIFLEKNKELYLEWMKELEDDEWKTTNN